METTTLVRDGRIGSQRPRLQHVPASVDTTGHEVISNSARAGLKLDPWQRHVIETTHGIGRDGLLSASEVCLICPRQNGKGSILESVELGWLFLSEEELILHSAHEFRTAVDAYKRIKTRIENHPEFDAKVKRYNNSHGQEGIDLLDGRSLKFIARTQGSGRGFPARKVVLDEAYDLQDQELSAILPTLAAAADAQVWYTSSAVNQRIHKNGLPLARVRRRGIAGGADLCFMEWSAPDDADIDDPENLYIANPGLGLRVAERSLLRDRRALSRKSYGVEHLGIGDWPDEDEAKATISLVTWDELTQPDSRITGHRVFALDVAPGGSHASISVAGRNQNGNSPVEIVATHARTRWAVEALARLQRNWAPIGTVIDMRSPAGGLAQDLEDAGVKLIQIKTGEVAAGFAGFVHKVMSAKTIRHLGQDTLREAIAGAKTRPVGDAETWDRKNADVDITGLVAATNALWAFTTQRRIDVSKSVW